MLPGTGCVLEKPTLRARYAGATRPGPLLSPATLMLGLVLASGCVASSITPAETELAGLDGIEIEAMEPPPLVAPLATLGSETEALGLLGPAGLLVAGGVFVADALGEPAGGPVGELNYEAMLRDSTAWVPTIILADTAAQVLMAGGRTGVTVRPGFVPVPLLEDRSATAHMENWYAPLRAWYNADTESVRPSATGSGRHGVVQVGILNYEIYDERLLLQVHMKLIDPESGKVIGRTRKSADEPVGDLDRLFVDRSSRFKRIFADIGARLVRESLEELKLVTPPRR